MKLTINGEDRELRAENLGALVEGLKMKPDRVAIELNREIVHFVGGGMEAQRS